VGGSADTRRNRERGDQLVVVERALADLSADKREAFVLKHVEGLSYEEMAAVTGERIPDAQDARASRPEELLKGWRPRMSVIDQRIHQVLDGELAAEAVPAELRRAVAQ